MRAKRAGTWRAGKALGVWDGSSDDLNGNIRMVLNEHKYSVTLYQYKYHTRQNKPFKII